MGVAVGSQPRYLSGMPMSMHSRIDQGSSVECSMYVHTSMCICMCEPEGLVRHKLLWVEY